MILKIKSTGRIICKDLKEAKSFKDRFLGLLDSSNPRNLLFKTRFGIHTLLLKEPIDVIVLDKEYKIVRLKRNVKPYNLVFWNPKYNLVLELLAGTIKKFSIKLDQNLELA